MFFPTFWINSEDLNQMFQGKKNTLLRICTFFDVSEQTRNRFVVVFFLFKCTEKKDFTLHRNIYFGELPYNVARVKCGEVAILLHVEQSHAGVVDDLKKNIIIKRQLNNIFYSKVNECTYTSTFTNYEAENL